MTVQLEPQAKRMRLSTATAHDSAPNVDQIHQFCRERLKSNFENIFEKYTRDFNEIGDEIDISTGEFIRDNGHLERMKNDYDTGIQNRYRQRPSSRDCYMSAQDSHDELSAAPNRATRQRQSSRPNDRGSMPRPLAPPQPSNATPRPTSSSNPDFSKLQHLNLSDSSIIQSLSEGIAASIVKALSANQQPQKPSVWDAPDTPFAAAQRQARESPVERSSTSHDRQPRNSPWREDTPAYRTNPASIWGIDAATPPRRPARSPTTNQPSTKTRPLAYRPLATRRKPFKGWSHEEEDLLADLKFSRNMRFIDTLPFFPNRSKSTVYWHYRRMLPSDDQAPPGPTQTIADASSDTDDASPRQSRESSASSGRSASPPTQLPQPQESSRHWQKPQVSNATQPTIADHLGDDREIIEIEDEPPEHRVEEDIDAAGMAEEMSYQDIDEYSPSIEEGSIMSGPIKSPDRGLNEGLLGPCGLHAYYHDPQPEKPGHEPNHFPLQTSLQNGQPQDQPSLSVNSNATSEQCSKSLQWQTENINLNVDNVEKSRVRCRTGGWSFEEEDRLMELRNVKLLPWDQIYPHFPDKSGGAIQSHFYSIQNQNRRDVGKLEKPQGESGPSPFTRWSQQEMILLRDLVLIRKVSLSEIVPQFPQRSYMSIKNRIMRMRKVARKNGEETGLENGVQKPKRRRSATDRPKIKRSRRSDARPLQGASASEENLNSADSNTPQTDQEVPVENSQKAHQEVCLGNTQQADQEAVGDNTQKAHREVSVGNTQKTDQQISQGSPQQTDQQSSKELTPQALQHSSNKQPKQYRRLRERRQRVTYNFGDEWDTTPITVDPERANRHEPVTPVDMYPVDPRLMNTHEKSHHSLYPDGSTGTPLKDAGPQDALHAFMQGARGQLAHRNDSPANEISVPELQHPSRSGSSDGPSKHVNAALLSTEHSEAYMTKAKDFAHEDTALVSRPKTSASSSLSGSIPYVAFPEPDGESEDELAM